MEKQRGNTSKETGNIGEELAAKHLQDIGYKIIARNWFDLKREIDIIALDGKTLVIVEVKYRTTGSGSEPYQNVNRKKQKLLVEAANRFVINKNLDYEVRFDVVSISSFNGKYQLEHIKNAFTPFG